MSMEDAAEIERGAHRSMEEQVRRIAAATVESVESALLDLLHPTFEMSYDLEVWHYFDQPSDVPWSNSMSLSAMVQTKPVKHNDPGRMPTVIWHHFGERP